MRVVDVPERERYEGRTEEGIVGFSDHRLEGGGIVLTHAEVTPPRRKRLAFLSGHRKPRAASPGPDRLRGKAARGLRGGRRLRRR